jgi:DNA (cytosine-5)-methyltransferase 1
MTRPRLLDLFCGAGGAAVGYHRAGFDVVGVDICPQPRYPFEFHQGDAMTWPLDGYDAIHASPPCQDHSRSHKPAAHGTGWMLAATREQLMATGASWIIENVPGAPMRADYRLCGCMFGLRIPGVMMLARDRWFETSWHGFELRSPCVHDLPIVTVSGTGGGVSHQKVHTGFAEWRQLMGIDWMTGKELAQAIPPAYTEYIGRQLLDHLADGSRLSA